MSVLSWDKNIHYYKLESGQNGGLSEYSFIRIDDYIKSYLKVSLLHKLDTHSHLDQLDHSMSYKIMKKIVYLMNLLFGLA